jgi:hypothetical protein
MTIYCDVSTEENLQVHEHAINALLKLHLPMHVCSEHDVATSSGSNQLQADFLGTGVNDLP